MEAVESDPNFEPQQRARSNTWPLPRPDNYVDKDEDPSKGMPGPGLEGVSAVGTGVLPKKNSSRRNAWGNMSYADLITQAIQSSPEKRLTLSQIYDWMVQNVPYFKDKGDSNSSAGWKNSIRHNLSLHNRFMRVQNEGTGKSSWWMINPDAKPGKAARRRATSMETQKYEKRRGRVKKKVEALRNGLDATPSPSSSISESLDMFPESPAGGIHPGFQLSPDFRPRASSNASSCGRLSPIPAIEGDQGASMSPMGWSQESMAHLYGADQLVDTLAETMKLGGSVRGSASVVSSQASTNATEGSGYLSECANLKANTTSQLSPHMMSAQTQLASNGFSMHQTNAYTGSQYGDYGSTYSATADGSKLSPLQRSPQRGLLHDKLNSATSYNITNLQALSPAPSVHSLSPPHSMDTTASPRPPSTTVQAPQPQPQPPQPRFGADQLVDNSLTLNPLPLSPQQSSAYNRSCNNTITSPANRLVATSGFCALTPALAGEVLPHHHLQHLTTPNAVQTTPGLLNNNNNNNNTQHTLRTCHHLKELTSNTKLLGPMPSASQMMGHLMAINSGIPNDLDLSIDSFQSELECDVDQVIRHELSVDGNLDFNFAEPQTAGVAASGGGHHWVH